MNGWHFLSDDCRLQFGERDKVEPGKWIRADGEIKMCSNGMHASKRIIDALKYAPGSRICRVTLRGELQNEDDKSVGRERRVEWWVDGDDLLRNFARRCALDVIHLWNAPEIVVQYLETGDESIRAAARDAAWAAARAAGDAGAAWAAARAAAWAARDAAWAARAARAAARDAARAAGDAGAAARAAQNRRLTSMVVAARRRGGV